MNVELITEENARLKEQNNALISLQEKYQAQIETQNFLIEKLQHQLNCLLRHRYGKKTEQINGKQLSLFGEDELKEPWEAIKEAHSDDALEPPKKPRNGCRNLPSELPRELITYDLSEAEKHCPECKGELHQIGKEISEQLEYVPASLKVKQHIRLKYGCRKCASTVLTADMPYQPIAKGLAGPNLLAHIIVSKYEDHIPLHRQERIFGRYGVELSKSTLCDWIMQCANLLSPLTDKLRQKILVAPKIHTDDTPILVQGEEKIKTGRLWVYIGCGGLDPPSIVYNYTENREGRWPQEFLKGYEGYLQADAYAGYDALYAEGKVVEIGCFAHVRRKFYDIVSQCQKATHAQEALGYIARLYAIEATAKDLVYEERKKIRQEKARPILEEFKKWLDAKAEAFPPKSPMGLAISYTTKLWAALTRYTEDGMLEIDNNRAERAIRPIAVGRKNWLFAGSDKGGKAAAIIYSLVETCKQNNIQPYEYLADVLARLPAHKINQIEELLPCNWKKQSTS